MRCASPTCTCVLCAGAQSSCSHRVYCMSRWMTHWMDLLLLQSSPRLLLHHTRAMRGAAAVWCPVVEGNHCSKPNPFLNLNLFHMPHPPTQSPPPAHPNRHPHSHTPCPAHCHSPSSTHSSSSACPCAPSPSHSHIYAPHPQTIPRPHSPHPHPIWQR